jgi:hypothetical protein
MKNECEKSMKTLAVKAGATNDANSALKFSQAAVNLANALACKTQTEAIKKV